MKKPIFNFLTEPFNAAESNAALPGEEKEVKNADDEAFYFLTVLFILIATVSIFKVEILRLLF